MYRTRYPLRGVVVGALLFATACAETAPGPRFDDETTSGIVRDLSCMKHQPQAPGTRYTDDTTRRTGETLALLRYYTANGAKPYCDGHGPTGIDRQWADLYVNLGADRKNVAALLDDEG
jgi:3',5'-cyclic AMP phosphodiesterase CpdA